MKTIKTNLKHPAKNQIYEEKKKKKKISQQAKEKKSTKTESQEDRNSSLKMDWWRCWDWLWTDNKQASNGAADWQGKTKKKEPQLKHSAGFSSGGGKEQRVVSHWRLLLIRLLKITSWTPRPNTRAQTSSGYQCLMEFQSRFVLQQHGSSFVKGFIPVWY